MFARLLSVAASGGVLMAAVAGRDAAQSVLPDVGPTATTGVTRALLIGVTSYANLAPRHQLEGPANDVALVSDMLAAQPFNVPQDRITTLVEPGARGEEPRRTGGPTRANIEREFRRLADRSGPGDQVVVMFAGHGSQQPDVVSGGDEDDGLDEILLPSDVGKWDGRIGAVDRAIVDDELGQWLTAIRNKGAFVWLLIDACQSTSAARGSTEAHRTVAPRTLGIADILPASRARSRGGSAELGMMGLAESAGGIAALYAAQTVEPTPEKKLPEDSKRARVHGLFTYTLVKTIQQASGRLTYRDVVERVIQHYRALGRIGPTPGFEGGGLDRPVLGTASFDAAPRLLLGPTVNGRTQLRAGAVHGLTRGVVLAVHPPDGQPGGGRPIGHVVVTDEPTATSSLVEPVAYGGVPAPAPERLTQNSRCEVVVFVPGLSTLKVAYEDVPGAPPALAEAAGAAVRQLEISTNGLATGVTRLADADWVVRATPDRQLTLTPSSGWRGHEGAGEGQRAPFAIAANDSHVAADLGLAFSGIARVSNLLKLASDQPPAVSGEVAIALDALRYHGSSAEPHRIAAAGTDPSPRVRVGDVIAFRLRNTGKVAVDVNVLYVDADYGVGVVFPSRDQEATAHLAPGEEITTTRMRVTPPTGWEEALVIATPRAGLRQDLRVLEQPPLNRLQSRGASAPGRTRAPVVTPLAALVRLVSERSGTRGQPVAEFRDYAIRMLTWRTESAQAPDQGAATPP